MLGLYPDWRAASSVLLSLSIFAGIMRSQPATPLPSDELVREKLDLWDPIYHPKELDDLVNLGEKALPIYLRIANDPKTNFVVRARVFGVVQRIKGDRHEFVEPALKSLALGQGDTPIRALRLLAEIGSSKDTPPMVALLWADDAGGIPDAANAAEAIAAVGSDRDVLALDIWLKTPQHKYDKELRPIVKECREKLSKRLEKKKR